MNRDAKRINPSLRPQIERVKSLIRNSNGGGFDGTGYVFDTAKREMKAELLKDNKTIILNRETYMYMVVDIESQEQLNLFQKNNMTKTDETPTPIEQRHINENGYKLPTGWTWEKVHSERKKAGQSEHYLPEVSSWGDVLWNFPIKGCLKVSDH